MKPILARDTGQTPNPILAALAILLFSILACASPGWTSAVSPTPILAGSLTPSFTPAVSPTPILAGPVTVTAIRSLNVRVRPSEQSSAYKKGLYHGDGVTLTGKCYRGWAQIEWLDGTAWVNADYLSDNKCKE